MHSALDHPRNQDTRNEIRGNGKRFKPRGQCAVGPPAKERRHQADRRPGGVLRTRLRRRREATHHPLKIMRPHGNVGIVDEQYFVARVRGKLHQRADLAVCAQALGALDELDRVLGKLRNQIFNRCRRGIVERTHSEQQLELARIILPAMTAEGIHHAGVEPFERFENAYVGRELGPRGAALAEKTARRCEAREKVAHPGHGQRRRYELDRLSQDVGHNRNCFTRTAVPQSGRDSPLSMPGKCRTRGR